MKNPLRSGSLLTLMVCQSIATLSAQQAAPKWVVEIPAPISDGTPATPAPEPEPLEFTVKSSRTQRMDVTKAPEMADLPPIKGTINVTVQMVEDPGLPDPPPPLPALPPDDPAVLVRMQELRKHYRSTKLVFLSATVYDRSRTLLRIYPNGKVEGAVAAWSNLDFNHFAGFSTFRVKTADGSFQEYGLLMGIGNNYTKWTRERLAQKGREYVEPKIPPLPDLAIGGPAFAVTEGDADSEAMDTLEQVHDLYRVEGARMAEAFIARVKARAKRKAWLLANPPVPKDVTIRFWERNRASSADRKQLEGEGEP